MAWDNARQHLLRHAPARQQRSSARPRASRRLTRDQMHAYFTRRYVAGEHRRRRGRATSTGPSSWSSSTDDVRPLGRRRRRPRHRAREHAGAGRRPRADQGRHGQQEHVLLMSQRPAGRIADCGTPPTRWPWPSATTPAAGCTGNSSTRATPSRPTAANDQNDGSGLLVTTFSCDPEKAAGEPRRSLRKVLAEVQQDGITDEEVEQAKNKIAVAGGARQRAADGPDAGDRRGVDLHRRVLATWTPNWPGSTRSPPTTSATTSTLPDRHSPRSSASARWPEIGEQV